MICVNTNYAPPLKIPRAREGWGLVARIVEGVREVRRFMNSLDQALRALHADQQIPALSDLEDQVWARVGRAQADEALARRWRQAQMLAVSVALVSGITFGGLEADASLRAQRPGLSLTDTGLAPSDLLEGRG